MIRHSRLRKITVLIGLWAIMFSYASTAFADIVDDMKGRQQGIDNTYSELDTRIKAMDSADPRKGEVEKRLSKAQDAKNAFVDLSAEDSVSEDGRPNAEFLEKEADANEKMNDVNRYLLAPVQPGASKVGEEGTVPQGSLTEDFIPNIVRLLFRFTSLMILVSFVVSGVMYVIAFDNEEFATKGKHMLYYSLIGFAFVTLAYAIVKAITQVNYFGIV